MAFETNKYSIKSRKQAKDGVEKWVQLELGSIRIVVTKNSFNRYTFNTTKHLQSKR